ncbi:MAG: DUF1858 domain-containing protein [Acidobacteriota bacterium]
MTDTVNPTTKVGPLLDAHPELEDVLIAISPEFRRLKNPLLRRTVARVATLEQAARIGGVPVPELVGRLRAALGQASPEAVPTVPGAAEDAAEPAWLAGTTPADTLEAEAILASGKTPVGAFVERLTHASPGQVVLLVAPFNPAPLIDAVTAKGYEVYTRHASERWEVWVRA